MQPLVPFSDNRHDSFHRRIISIVNMNSLFQGLVTEELSHSGTELAIRSISHPLVLRGGAGENEMQLPDVLGLARNHRNDAFGKHLDLCHSQQQPKAP